MLAQCAGHTVNTDELVDFMSLPSSYPHNPARVELSETHISWVFLAGRHAYKLKKPVKFDFLDFSSPGLRRQACHAELRLNRRVSPQVYLAVVPICRQYSGQLKLGGPGEPVDWCVKMRRLDDRRTLKAQLSGAGVERDRRNHFSHVANYLADFYASQAPLTLRTAEFRNSLRHHVDDNERQLVEIARNQTDFDSIALVHSAQRRFLVTHQQTFDDRVRDGRIVDGHGDLRPEHIYLYTTPVLIDCIEFNAEYRQNDIADELAFLAIECNLLGNWSLESALFDAYARASNDRPPDRLIAFYKAYRACVRAKVAAIRSEQQSGAQLDSSLRVEHDYLRLANRYIQDLGPQLVILVGGLMGTGKSTLARQLGERLSAPVLSSDALRRGTTSITRVTDQFGQGRYTHQSRLRVYERLMSNARRLLARSATVIFDATFTSSGTRVMAEKLAKSCGAEILQLECVCPREVAISRIAERRVAGGSASEALPEFYDLQVAEAENPLAQYPTLTIQTTLPIGQQVEESLSAIREIVNQSAPCRGETR